MLPLLAFLSLSDVLDGHAHVHPLRARAKHATEVPAGCMARAASASERENAGEMII